MTATSLVRIDARHDGWVRLVLDQPPGNILTMAMCDALAGALADACVGQDTKLVSIEGAGAHFSYGASVEEHAPARVGEMLPAFHGLIGALLSVPCPTAAIVRGRCLGGGLEVVLACDLVFASADARLGVPEVVLGVFPPAAAALLPLRIGASRASRVVLSGEALPAAWWESAGLVSSPAPPTDLDTYVHQWFETYAAPRSAVALRHAASAARTVLRDQVMATLPRLERQYLDTLMLSDDAAEGCAAFAEKRAPVWRNR
jgi:cyclohexa-1,5-dienecarbonyl-CoA hydratase